MCRTICRVHYGWAGAQARVEFGRQQRGQEASDGTRGARVADGIRGLSKYCSIQGHRRCRMLQCRSGGERGHALKVVEVIVH
jgi:hypothetical protein